MNLITLNLKRNLSPDNDNGGGGNNPNSTTEEFESKILEAGLPKEAAKFFVDDNNSNPNPLSDNNNNDDKQEEEEEEGKEEIVDNNNEEEEEEEEQLDLIESLNKDLGIEIKSDELEVETDDTYDKVKAYIEKALSKTKQSERESAVNELKESNPLLKYVLDGYSEKVINHEEVIQTLNSIELDPEDDKFEDVAKELIKQVHAQKNIDEEESEDIIATAIANNTLLKKATKAKEELLSIAEKQKEEQIKLEDKLKKEEEDSFNKIIDTIKTTVKSGFNGIKLNEKEAEEFAEYVTKTDPKTKLSPADVAFYKLDNESKLTIDYIIKKGLLKDVAKFVNGTPAKNTKTDKKFVIDMNEKRPKLPKGGSNSSKSDKIIGLKELKQALEG